MANKRIAIAVLLIGLCGLAQTGSSAAGGGDTIEGAPVVAPESTVSGSIDPAQSIFYRLDLKAGQMVTLDLATNDRWNEVCMEDFDPDTNDYNIYHVSSQWIGGISFVCTDVNTGTAELKGVAPASGLWTLRVYGCDTACTSGLHTYGYSLAFHTPTATINNRVVRVVACCDSFASGEGTQAFPAISSGCHQTDAAWPNLLPYSVTNIACSGAKVDALFSPFKGHAPQILQLKGLSPDIVVMMVGGNDALYSTALRNCLRYDCAAGKLNQNFEAIRLLRSKLAVAYEATVEATEAKLFVVGYPRVFPAYPAPIINCSRLKNAERLMLNNLGTKLQKAEVDAVADANMRLGLKGSKRIQFISTTNALAGHELCSANSWMFKINFPACLKDSRCGHPTALGQEAIAEVVRKPLHIYTG